MKYILKREKFIKESYEYIDSICMKLGLSDYEIVDGIVNVDGDVIICKSKLDKIPIQFGRVTGRFDCSENRLLSLKGCPSFVGGDFICKNNRKLKSLEYCPSEVEGSFECDNCVIESLEHSPSKIGLDFYCWNNSLTSLKYCPSYVGRDFDCADNNLTSLEFGPTTVNRSYDCSDNELTSLIGCPEKVSWRFYCHNNKLTSLEGVPVVGDSTNNSCLDCSDNELTSLDYCQSNIHEFICKNNPVYKWWYRISKSQFDNELLEMFIDMGINTEDPDEYNENRIKEILE